MIDKQSPIPIYYQIQEHLRSMIENKELNPGEAIPSERELAEKYDISRMTVRQAITNLANEGLLVREKGKGSFVAEQKIEQPLMQLTSFSEDMRRRGIEPGTLVKEFQIVKASAKVSDELQLPEGEEIYQLNRLRLGDGEPMAYEILSLPKEKLPLISEEIVKGSFYNYIEKEMGLSIERAVQSFEPSLATELESEMLNIEVGSPVLLLRRTTYLSDGSPFEHVKSTYRGDRYKFVAEMKR
ncbi:GntR family transcriptional regulator [Halobacillus mangrovi]|uniref:GntR family transcriptional regulator n=1 Tax=Halobacillus mangrovi TaxID=402384 RepID=UPI003D953A0B